MRNDSKCFEILPLGFYSGIVKCEIPPVHRSLIKQVLFRSKHRCWEKDIPISLKTPLLGEGPIPSAQNTTVREEPTSFVQNPTVGRRPYPFRSNHTVGRRTQPLSLKTPLLGEGPTPFHSKPHCWENPFLCSKPHCWEKGLSLSFKTPLLREGPTPFVMFETFLHRLVSGVFEENIKIFNFRIVLLVGALKDFNFFCSIFST